MRHLRAHPANRLVVLDGDDPPGTFPHGGADGFHVHAVEHDVEVDIASNCGSLFKREFYDNLDKWYDFCGTISMDDIYVNYFAKKKGVRRIVLAHQEGYLKHKQQFPEDNYVFDKHRYSDSVQTEFINKYFNVL